MTLKADQAKAKRNNVRQLTFIFMTFGLINKIPLTEQTNKSQEEEEGSKIYFKQIFGLVVSPGECHLIILSPCVTEIFPASNFRRCTDDVKRHNVLHFG